MNKKNTSHEKLNLFFSAFLIIAYIICGYFFVSFVNTQSNELVKNILMVVIFAVFGLLVFYATRVGEKKIVKRFSLVTLIVLDLPTLFIILSYIIGGFPLHEAIAGANGGAIALMAAIALGYGIPYTFISGFETDTEDEEEEETDEAEEEETLLEGGIEADIKDADEEISEPEQPTYESDVDEIVVEGTAVIEE
ncbi:MAG: hypothetical protein J1E41_02010 [Ruminococcus sp.]|nr:hypothetical protein [Ruminococcus sp.]